METECTATVLQFLVVGVVELEDIEPPSMHCECIVLPLNYGPISELCVEPPPGIEPGTQAS